MDLHNHLLIVKELLEHIKKLPHNSYHNALITQMTRLYNTVQSLEKLNSPLDYQAICFSLRNSLELATDISILIQTPSLSLKMDDWNTFAKAKSGRRILNWFNGANIPTEYKPHIDWLNNNQSKIDSLKQKHNWSNSDPWHGMSLEKAIEKIGSPQNEIHVKNYLHLYSVMNWGTHGSGSVIENNFSDNTFSSLLECGRKLCCLLALVSIHNILIAIKFDVNDLRRKCFEALESLHK